MASNSSGGAPQRRFRGTILAISVTLLALTGCAGRGPILLPTTGVVLNIRPDGSGTRSFDIDGDGRLDFIENLDQSGRAIELQFDDDHDGVFETKLAWPCQSSDVRDLIVLVDSVPYEVVREAWGEGKFRLFRSPTCTVSTFPAMTDPAIDEIFHMSPCRGMEALYCENDQRAGGLGAYLEEANAPWIAQTDYHLASLAHSVSYLDPGLWYLHELGRIQEHFQERSDGRFIGYVVSTSGLGARLGREGHESAVDMLDRFCDAVVYRTRGHVRITLMSDHGHAMKSATRADLADFLARHGYHVSDRLTRRGDVIIPVFGLVSCTAIYTHEPERAAADLLGATGVEFTIYRDANGMRVRSRDGDATIAQNGDKFRYVAQNGDPLRFLPALQRLKDAGRVDADGWIASRNLFDATNDAEFPDAIYRIATADALFEHPPQVYVSFTDGYYSGDAGINAFVGIRAVHGNLRSQGSSGFVMTTGGELPAALRNADIAEELKKVGVTLRR